MGSTVCLGSSAQFMCAVKTSDVANVFYLVNSMTLAEVAYQGVVVSHQ